MPRGNGPAGTRAGRGGAGGGGREPFRSPQQGASARPAGICAHTTMPPREAGALLLVLRLRRRAHGAAVRARTLGIRLLVGFLNFSLNTAAAVYRVAVIAGPLPDLGGVLIPAGRNLGPGGAAA